MKRGRPAVVQEEKISLFPEFLPRGLLGGSVTAREGSRVKITLQSEHWYCHRPHPGKEAKRYQVEEARELLERVGVKP